MVTVNTLPQPEAKKQDIDELLFQLELKREAIRESQRDIASMSYADDYADRNEG